MAEISYRHPDIAIIHHALFKKCNVMFLVKKQNSNIFHSYKFFSSDTQIQFSEISKIIKIGAIFKHTC